MPFDAWLLHNTGENMCCCRLLSTGLLYVSTALRLLRRHYAGGFLQCVDHYLNEALMPFEAWLLHNNGTIFCCRRLLTGLLYESTALRLLRRHYAGDFLHCVDYYPNDALTPFDAWLSHNTGENICCCRLLTGLLYVSTALRLLRRHYAGDFLHCVDHYLNDALMPFDAWLLHNTTAISCCRRLLTGLLYVSTALRLLRRHYAGDF
jgi:hypothetical protein